jgi:chemotaxis protein methyltransferase CheR
LIVPDDSIDTVDGIGQLETKLLVEAVYRRYGLDFRGFAREALEHKLVGLQRAAGLDNISTLQGRVLHDADYARGALRTLSASSSDFFTTGACFNAMRCAALPLLRSASWPVVWVAECGDPGLVIALAIMLEEEGLLGKTQLFVTSANDDVLADIGALAFPAELLAARDEDHFRSGGKGSLSAYCELVDGSYRLRDDLRHNIVWGQYDLASDASFNEFHLVICQRPLREFDHELQRRALGVFADSLCNFGILQVEPPSDVLAAEFAKTFISLLSEQGIYRKLP